MHDLITLTISSVQKLNGILEAFVGELICERLLSLSVCPMDVFIHVISDLFIFLQDAEPLVHLYFVFLIFFSLSDFKITDITRGQMYYRTNT